MKKRRWPPIGSKCASKRSAAIATRRSHGCAGVVSSRRPPALRTRRASNRSASGSATCSITSLHQTRSTEPLGTSASSPPGESGSGSTPIPFGASSRKRPEPVPRSSQASPGCSSARSSPERHSHRHGSCTLRAYAGCRGPRVDVVIPFRGTDEQLSALRGRMAALALRDGDTLTVVDNREDAIASSYYARNRGAAAGSGEWIVFLDADTTPAARPAGRVLRARAGRAHRAARRRHRGRAG